MTLVISGSIALSPDSEILPLTHPRIGYENLLRGDDVTITVSSEQDGYERDSVTNGFTWDFWKPETISLGVPAVIAFEFTEAKEINYCGIAAHNLTTVEASAELQYYDYTTSAWVSLGEVLPGSGNGNKIIMFLFDTVFASLWRVIIRGEGDTPAIGVINLGKTLDVERRLYQGHTPITLSKKTVIKPQLSEGGQWLGRSIIRNGASTNISLKNLTAAWIRTFFYPFMEQARIYPFFWAWRPEDYPDEMAYCQITDDIRPTNSGPRDLMSVNFLVNAIVE